MTDRDIIERVDSLFPSANGIWSRPPEMAHHKASYVWSVAKRERVEEFIHLVRPWLGERRSAKARDVLAWLDSRPGAGSYNRVKTHCPKGHPYDMFEPKGSRRCRRCKNEKATIKQREYRAAKRAAQDLLALGDA